MSLRTKLMLIATLPVLVSLLILAQDNAVPHEPLAEALIAGVITALVLSTRLFHALLRPLMRLRGAARHLGASDSVEQAARTGEKDELGQLAATFTELAHEVRHSLRDAQERHQETDAIFARMADGILVVDTDLRIRHLNPAAAELLALTPERVLGHTVIEATMHHALDGLFRDALAAGHTLTRRMETIQPRRHVLQALVTPLEAAMPGSGPGAVAVLQDLTEFDRVERVRRDFMANVSHELRTPVTSIKVMVESLQRGALQRPDLASSFLQSIGDAADRLAKLVDDVLALARVEAGPGRLEWQTVFLDDLMEEVLAAQQPLAREYGIHLQIDHLEPLSLTGDAEGLRQALTNLSINAIKYNRPGGAVHLRLTHTPQGISLQVTDTGIGIPAEHLPRIFERFYRVDRGRSRELGGTGLGLAIVKHVVEAHGGQVTVESTPEAGSTFTLILPETQQA